MNTAALDAAVKSLAGAEAAGTVFNVLIEALAGAAPRGAIFLVRQREIRGWSSFGYPVEATRRQSAFSSPLHAGRLGRVMADPRTDVDQSPGVDPDFGQGRADESILTSVSIKGKPIAGLLIERDAGEQPWDSAVVGVLSAFARLRLELTLAQRKLQAAEQRAAAKPQAPAGTGVAAASQDEATVHSPQTSSSEAEHVSDVKEVKEFKEGPGTPDEEPNLELAAARRFARLVATDIRLYNEEAVALGRLHRDLAERLSPSIKRGKDTFVERHGDLGEAGLDLLLEAYVNVLASGDAELLPDSLLK